MNGDDDREEFLRQVYGGYHLEQPVDNDHPWHLHVAFPREPPKPRWWQIKKRLHARTVRKVIKQFTEGL